MDTPKLIILRGNAGAGKSSTARLLREQSQRKIALVEQDYYRQKVLLNLENSKQACHDMVVSNTLIALQYGYDVILDSIFHMPRARVLLDRILAEHPTENYMFHFTVTFEETLRRHSTRDKAAHFGEADMREWYEDPQPSGYPFERVIPEHSTLEQTVALIREQTGI